MTVARKPVEPWDSEWAAERAAEALRWLGRRYPEGLDASVLSEHEEAANVAALAGDKDAYLEALRCYMRAGRDEALRIRQGAA
jgi:hypothetical protein